ncbi:hypothetical protein GCM10007049_15940 [Echinicola pacifica]|uniref:Uncharacterized protein n=1 Tax=Echinicola pacifica TaxID=346377 RepID=A0A918UNZ4_9BACT|nr:hypothetical protein [Echinicola pacifica]GGZ23746.1 hypothetical protein GCM10007049_15940 [Echinicola pacifica]
MSRTFIRLLLAFSVLLSSSYASVFAHTDLDIEAVARQEFSSTSHQQLHPNFFKTKISNSQSLTRTPYSLESDGAEEEAEEPNPHNFPNSHWGLFYEWALAGKVQCSKDVSVQAIALPYLLFPERRHLLMEVFLI